MQGMLLGLVTIVAAPALKDGKGPDIVGEWIVQTITSTARARPFEKDELRYIFTADGKWSVYRGDARIGSGTRGYRADTAKSPAQIDLISDTTEQNPTISACVFKIEGDTLTLRFAPYQKPRPTDFEVNADKPGTLYTMKRAKKKE